MAKQVIIMRHDLGMNRGKLVAQGAHASLSVILKMMTKEENAADGSQYSGHKRTLDVKYWSPLYHWLEGRFTKVCLRVDSEEDLVDLYVKAEQAGLPCTMITDAGLTEFHGVPTRTCIAIGPADDEAINAITGHLKLYS